MSEVSEKWRARQDALDVLEAREESEKHRDALFARFEERRALARLITRRYGVIPGHAWQIAVVDPTSPLITEGLRKRGRPPGAYELFEAIEAIRVANKGTLPIRRGVAFWRIVTSQWNVMNSVEHRERQYVAMDGLPDWRKLQSAYRVAAPRIEKKIAALYATHRTSCAACLRREIIELLGATQQILSESGAVASAPVLRALRSRSDSGIRSRFARVAAGPL